MVRWLTAFIWILSAWGLASGGARAMAAGEAAIQSGNAWRITLQPMPAIAYEGEMIILSVDVANSRPETRDLELAFVLDGEAPQVWRGALGGGQGTTIAFPWRVAMHPLPRRGQMRGSMPTEAAGPAATPFWHSEFTLRDGRGDLSGLRAEGGSLFDARGNPVTLAHRSDDDAAHRRWMPVRRMAAAWRQRNAPRFVWIPPAMLRGMRGGSDLSDAPDAPDGPDMADAAVNGGVFSALPGARALTFFSYGRNPLAAMLAQEPEAPWLDGHPAMGTLAWGFLEAYDRYPLPVFVRALDLTIDRARAKNPRLRLALATPLPIPGEPEASNRYAEAIRRLARDKNAVLIDLHAACLTTPDWERFFRLPEGDGAAALFPNNDGASFLLDALAEALW